jgi:hypothetical protein
MTIEYKFVEEEKTDEQKILELKEYLMALEEVHKIESDKDTPDTDRITSLETEINSKRTEYESLGGTYD